MLISVGIGQDGSRNSGDASSNYRTCSTVSVLLWVFRVCELIFVFVTHVAPLATAVLHVACVSSIRGSIRTVALSVLSTLLTA